MHPVPIVCFLTEEGNNTRVYYKPRFSIDNLELLKYSIYYYLYYYMHV